MITPDPVFSTRWRPGLLVAMHLAAALLLLSFIHQGGHALWRSLDTHVFYALNGSLFASETWARFWAWMNTRELDAVSALFMLAFLIFPGLGLKRNQLQAGFTGFLLLMILMLPMREALSEYSEASGLSGPSPSLQLEPAYRFSAELPDIPAKDSASTSFPGDHASVLMVWLGFLLFNSRSLGTLTATVLALLLISPRLFGGAHWFTDAAVGGLSLALVTLAWAWASPLPHLINQGLMRLLGPVYRLAGRIPLLGRLPFFTG